MVAKQTRRMVNFSEQDDIFIKQIAGDIGCHYSKANDRTYNLNKFKSDVQGEKCVFAWVHKECSESFWVATRKIWVEQARTKETVSSKIYGANRFLRDNQQAEGSVCFDIKDDYQKAVSILTLIKKIR